ncbi:MAG TPA: hypothetical protein VFR86_24800 [Burkholderiaceae bacterium]|nr:hypothetical protein [Burkholderiaceae bacterium]
MNNRQDRPLQPRICAFLFVSIGGMMSCFAQAQTAPPPAKAASKAETAHRQEDIARHRQMARAHEEAAKCLEAGEKESACQARLREACKGIAVGPYCGMRHGH